MAAYYNEIEPYAADWLENLIKRGLIAAGDVDRRSIVDVHPDDLRAYTQCHFFAGIGGWSYALRLAGWPDDRLVWTGSCPCQPFSAAGRQRGSEDERHLWPAFWRLIRECRPAVVFGEQVAGAAGYAWADHVGADVESEGYAFAACDIGAHSVGAPHIRQRLYWVAHSAGPRPLSGTHAGVHRREKGAGSRHGESERCRAVGELADADRTGSLLGERDGEPQQPEQPAPRRHDADGCGAVCGLGDAFGTRSQGRERPGDVELHRAAGEIRPTAAAGIPSPWAALIWLPCYDGKARPTQPGLQPLAHGVPGRVGRLRAYGNAIIPQVAAEFVASFVQCSV